VKKSNSEIAKDAVRRARIRFPKAGRWRLFNESRKTIVRERYGFPLWLLLSILWPLIMELAKRDRERR